MASAHLTSTLGTTGPKEAAQEVKRTAEIEKIMTVMGNKAGSAPIILGMDSNTWQAWPFAVPASRTTLLAGGWYDTASNANIAARLASYRWSTKVAKYGTALGKPGEGLLGARLDVVVTKNLPGSDDYSIDTHPETKLPGSDHYLVRSVLRLPTAG